MESSNIKGKYGFIKLGRILLKIGTKAFGTLGSRVQIAPSRPINSVNLKPGLILRPGFLFSKASFFPVKLFYFTGTIIPYSNFAPLIISIVTERSKSENII